MLLHPLYQASNNFSASYGNLERGACKNNQEIPYIEGQLYFSTDRMIVSFSKLFTVR